MKTIKYLLFSFLFVSLFSCDVETEDIVTENATTGGLLYVKTKLLSYVVGNEGPYSATFRYDDAPVQTTSVDIYKRFTRSEDGVSSNEALLTTISDINLGDNTFEFSYADLIEGLSIDGNPLPTNDSGLEIGDYFELVYKSNTSNNTTTINATKTKVSVATRLAGLYDVTANTYFHYGSDYSGALVGTVRTIESIGLTDDYAIYKFSDFIFWDGEGTSFYFYVDNEPIVAGGNEYQITVPNEYEGNQQLFVGTYDVVDCSEMGPVTDPFPYTCDDNKVILMNDGHDVINMVYGYLGSGSHINPDYEVCVKQ